MMVLILNEFERVFFGSIHYSGYFWILLLLENISSLPGGQKNLKYVVNINFFKSNTWNLRYCIGWYYYEYYILNSDFVKIAVLIQAF